MIDFEEISIDKKDEINSYLKSLPGINSEKSFATLFVWRKGYNIKYAIADGVLLLSSHLSGEDEYIGIILPKERSFNLKGAVNKIIGFFKDGFVLRLYDSGTVEMLNDTFPDRFVISENRNSFDYIYSTEKLIRLSGKKYHTKKNHINKFKKLYPDCKYERLSAADKDECTALFDKWYSGKKDTDGLDSEREAICEMFGEFDSLNLIGGGLRTDGELVAFSFGERLNSDTALIHFEHANNDYIGSFTEINRCFLEREFADLKYVNREEDMGLPGLRQAKMSYKPEFFAKKFDAKLREPLKIIHG